jgi:hypothetical protein
MTTHQKIWALIDEMFAGYRGYKMKELGFLHFSIWQTVGDERFLTMLEEWNRKLPTPKYEVPEVLHKLDAKN